MQNTAVLCTISCVIMSAPASHAQTAFDATSQPLGGFTSFGWYLNDPAVDPQWIGQPFTAEEGGQIQSISFIGDRSNTDAAPSWILDVFTADANDLPDTLLGSQTYSSSVIPVDGFALFGVDFSAAGVALQQGERYVMVLRSDQSVVSSEGTFLRISIAEDSTPYVSPIRSLDAGATWQDPFNSTESLRMSVQVPAPGAGALLGGAALLAPRRRRA